MGTRPSLLALSVPAPQPRASPRTQAGRLPSHTGFLFVGWLGGWLCPLVDSQAEAPGELCGPVHGKGPCCPGTAATAPLSPGAGPQYPHEARAAGRGAPPGEAQVGGQLPVSPPAFQGEGRLGVPAELWPEPRWEAVRRDALPHPASGRGGRVGCRSEGSWGRPWLWGCAVWARPGRPSWAGEALTCPPPAWPGSGGRPAVPGGGLLAAPLPVLPVPGAGRCALPHDAGGRRHRGQGRQRTLRGELAGAPRLEERGGGHAEPRHSGPASGRCPSSSGTTCSRCCPP